MSKLKQNPRDDADIGLLSTLWQLLPSEGGVDSPAIQTSSWTSLGDISVIPCIELILSLSCTRLLNSELSATEEEHFLKNLAVGIVVGSNRVIVALFQAITQINNKLFMFHVIHNLYKYKIYLEKYRTKKYFVSFKQSFHKVFPSYIWRTEVETQIIVF